MRYQIFLSAVACGALLVACAASDPPAVRRVGLAAPSQPPAPPLHRVPKPTAPSLSPGPALPVPPVEAPSPPVEDPDHGESGDNPSSLLTAADQARVDALGYIVWAQSQPGNIVRMNALTDSLNATLKTMQDNKVGNTYQPADVAAASTALTALKTFLRTKGD